MQMSQLSQNQNNRLFIEYLFNIKDNKDALYNYYTNPATLKNLLDSFPGVKYSDAFEILHDFVFEFVVTTEQKPLFGNLLHSSPQKLEQYFDDIEQIRTEFANSISDEEILKILNLVIVIKDRIQQLRFYLNLKGNELQIYSLNPNELDKLVEKFSLPKKMITKSINTYQSRQSQNNLYNPNQNLYYQQSQNFNPSPYPQQQNFPMNQPPFFNPNEFNNPSMQQTITRHSTNQSPNPSSQNNWEYLNYNQNSNFNSSTLRPHILRPHTPLASFFSQNNFHNQNSISAILTFENDIKSLISIMESIKNSNELSKIAEILNVIPEKFMIYINFILDVLREKERDDDTTTKLKVIMQTFKKSNLNVKDINSIVTFFISLSEVYPIENDELLKKQFELIKNSKFLPTVAENLGLDVETLISYMDYIINILGQENINDLYEFIARLNHEDPDAITSFIVELLENISLSEMPKKVNNNNNQQKEEDNNANTNDNEEKNKSSFNSPQPISLTPDQNNSKKYNSDEDEIEFQEELLNSHNAKAQNSENQQLSQTETPEKSQKKPSIFDKINKTSEFNNNEPKPKFEPDINQPEKDK